MPNLSDFIGGGQTAPAEPQPGANDPGYAERKAGWLSALQEMTKDPVSLGMMVQLGTSLANPRQGANFAGQVSGAMNDALRYKGRYGQMEEERKLTEQKQAREDRRVGMEERRAGQADERLAFERERGQATDVYNKERLRVEELRARNEGIRARNAGRASTSDFRFTTAQIQEETGLPFSEASQIAREILSKKNPEDMLVTISTKLYETWAADPLMSRKFTPDELKQRAMEDAQDLIARGAPQPQPGVGAMPEAGMETAPNSEQNPVVVKTVEEAMALPPGTWIQRPDGRIGKVPERK